MKPVPTWSILLLPLGACSSPAVPPSTDNVAIEVAPLNLPGIDFACYDVLVENQDAQTVVAIGDPASSLLSATPDAETLCSTQYGNGPGGGIFYVAPCDASRPNHTVTLWVDGLYRGTPAAPSGVDYQDPCPGGCELAVPCTENADAPVVFNLTIMRPAVQGFFDVAVNFDDIFCSAKVDCAYSETESIEVLFHPDTGKRAQTAVLALACTAGPDGSTGDTVLFRDPIVVDCGGVETVLDPTLGAGNVYGPVMTDPDANDAVWQYATYFGSEDLDCGGQPCAKLFWNVAIGFDPAVADCTLRTRATAAGPDAMPTFATPPASTWPFIEHEVRLTAVGGGLACSQHPLNGAPAGVSTRYTPVSTPEVFCHRYDGAAFASTDPTACANGIDTSPLCPDGTLDHAGDLDIASPLDVPPNYACIAHITGRLSIRDDAPNLAFTSLVSIAGTGSDALVIDQVGLTGPRTFGFPALSTIGGRLVLSGNGAIAFTAPLLATIGGDIALSGNQQALSIALPSVEALAFAIQIDGNSGPIYLSMGALVSAGALTLANNTSTVALNLAALAALGSSSWSDNGALVAVDLVLDSLTTVTTSFLATDNAALSTCFLQALLGQLASTPAVTIDGNLIDSCVWSRAFGPDDLWFEPQRVAAAANERVVMTGYVAADLSLGGATLTSEFGSEDGFVAAYGELGGHLWSRRFANIDGNGGSSAYGIAVDSADNVIVSGEYGGPVDFGGITGNDLDAMFVAKLDPNGDLIWLRSYAGSAVGFVAAVTVSDAIVISGDFSGTTNLGGSDLISAGARDVFLLALDSAGNHLASERFGGPGDDRNTGGLAIAPNGDVLITGAFSATVNFGGSDLVSAGGWDVFVARFGASGNHVWSRRFGNGGDDYYGNWGGGIAVDPANGQVVFTGCFSGAINFGGADLIGNGSERDGFLVRLAADGTHLWSRRIGGGPQEDVGVGVAIDQAGAIALTGWYAETADVGGATLIASDVSLPWDAFVARLDSSGDALWAVAANVVGSAGNSWNPEAYATGVAVTAGGSVVGVGIFVGDVDFGQGPLANPGDGSHAYIVSIPSAP